MAYNAVSIHLLPMSRCTCRTCVLMECPCTSASPLEMRASPVTMRNVLVLPAPFTPSSPKHSPLRTAASKHSRYTASSANSTYIPVPVSTKHAKLPTKRQSAHGQKLFVIFREVFAHETVKLFVRACELSNAIPCCSNLAILIFRN